MNKGQKGGVGFVLASAVFSATPAMANIPYTAGDVPTEYAVIQASASGSIPVGVRGEVLLQFRAGGTGTLVENDPTADAAMNWSIDPDGRLRVIPRTPATYTHTEFRNVCSGVWFGTLTTTDHLLVRRLATSTTSDRLEITAQNTTRYVDPVPGDACPAPAPVTYTSTGSQVGYMPAAGIGMTATDISRALALPHRMASRRSGWTSQWSTALFNTGTGRVYYGLGIQPTFTHSLVNGRLQVSAVDESGTRLTYDHRRLQRDYRGGDGLFTVATFPDGRRAVYYDYAPLQQKFAMLSMKGTWYSGFSETSTNANIAYSTNFTSLPTASGPGLGSRVTGQFDPSTSRWTYSSTPFSWTITGHTVQLQTYRLASGQPAATCPAGATCTLLNARRWQLVSRVSDDNGYRPPSYVRLNMIETLLADNDGNGQLADIDQRANFYQQNLRRMEF